MKRLLPLLLVALAACGAPDSSPESAAQGLLASAFGDELLGTIEATVDGRAMTWYGPVFSLMLETGADPAPYRREFPVTT